MTPTTACHIICSVPPEIIDNECKYRHDGNKGVQLKYM